MEITKDHFQNIASLNSRKIFNEYKLIILTYDGRSYFNGKLNFLIKFEFISENRVKFHFKIKSKAFTYNFKFRRANSFSLEFSLYYEN